MADGDDQRVVRHERPLGEGQVDATADAGDEVRLELGRRNAEPARLGDPTARVLDKVGLLPLRTRLALHVLVLALVAALAPAQLEVVALAPCVESSRMRVWTVGCVPGRRRRGTPHGTGGDQPERLEPHLLLVFLHAGQADHPADVRGIWEPVRRPMPELTLSAAEMVTRAEGDGKVGEGVKPNLGQVPVRQQVGRQRRLIHLPKKSLGPCARQEQVDTVKTGFNRAGSQGGNSVRRDLAAVAPAGNECHAQPRQINCARNAQVDNVRRQLAAGPDLCEQRVERINAAGKHVRAEWHDLVARSIRCEHAFR
mmetsp:Transcript_17547/g.57462  ORF Transcript_17547/g.57462 Transcript_17547/m.57462 type:complete len:311 (+) Transcript_17547:446-1378(+)|eukprot:scaffold3836_cov125-Isochrysis_galbana.AAC.15